MSGIDLYERKWPPKLKGSRIGLLSVHPASVNRRLQDTVNLFRLSYKSQLRALFGPQHGIRGETQDNMIEWEGFFDQLTGLPVFSLYGQNRKPGPSMLKDIDAMVIDLQDIGSRYYTFIWTLELCMQTCIEMKKSVFESLASLKLPLVQVRGQWVQLDSEQIEAAIRFWDNMTYRSYEFSLLEAARFGLGGSESPGDLPVNEVVAEGCVKDLARQA